MSEFRRFHKLDGKEIEINLDNVLYVQQSSIGHTVHLHGCSIALADWQQYPVDAPAAPVTILPKEEQEPCVQCSHMPFEHARTYDGRFKCRVCADDEDRVDCLVTTPEYLAYVEDEQRRWREDPRPTPSQILDRPTE